MKQIKKWTIRVTIIAMIGILTSWFWCNEWRKPPQSKWKEAEAKTKRQIKIYKQELKWVLTDIVEQ